MFKRVVREWRDNMWVKYEGALQEDMSLYRLIATGSWSKTWCKCKFHYKKFGLLLHFDVIVNVTEGASLNIFYDVFRRNVINLLHSLIKMSQKVFTDAPSMTFFTRQNIIEGQISCSQYVINVKYRWFDNTLSHCKVCITEKYRWFNNTLCHYKSQHLLFSKCRISHQYRKL
jgi:hypothetical protein